MMPHSALFRRLRCDRGVASVELIIFLPFIVGFIAVFVTLWDAFRTANVSLYASYTVADNLARKRDIITDADLQELGTLYEFLVNAPGDTAVRFTVLERELDPDGNPRTVWKYSYSTNPGIAPATTETADVAAHVPVLALGNRIYVTEAFTDWSPIYGQDLLPGRTMYHVAATPPRFTSPRTQAEQDAIDAAAENPDVDGDYG